MLIDIVQTYDEHLFDSSIAGIRPARARTRDTMTTMAMAPALPGTTARATLRATISSSRPVVTPRPAVTGSGSVDGPSRVARSSVTAPPRAGSRGLAGLHLTARGRVALWFMAIVMVAAAVLVTSRAAADGPVSAQQVERHVVQSGETMWQIAADIAGPGEDVRDVVFDLVRLNELPDAGLMAGQVIVVPVD